jgi:hypothetical protein
LTTVDATAEALKTRIETLATSDYGVQGAFEWGDAIPVSGNRAVAVIEYDGNAEVAMGDASDIRFKVTVLVSKSSDRVARSRLYAFAGPADTSDTIRAAVNGTLGGLVAFATVTWDSGVREYAVGGGDDAAANYLGIEFAVLVGA